MFRDILDSSSDEMVRFRLDLLKARARALSFPTKTEAQAEVASSINRILALGNRMSPLIRAGAAGPAVVEDVATNLELLNQDAQGIVSFLNTLEQDAAKLFNLSAASQTTLRQRVREQVFASTRRMRREAFINDAGLDLKSSSASYDFGVGSATLPFIGQSKVAPSRIEVGVLSDGRLETALETLLDSAEDTALDWRGPQLELVFTFSQPTIINRISISLDDYQGLVLESLTSSPDGVLREDLLAEMPVSARSLDGSSNKFSGDVTLDFDPRHSKQVRLIVSDRAGVALIRLREISFWARRYSSTAIAQAKPVLFPELGVYIFRASDRTAPPLTSVSHQVSFDGVQYRAIASGEEIDLGGKKGWYRAVLSRADSSFATLASPVDKPGQDPSLSQAYRINNTGTLDLSNGVIERTLNVDLRAPAVIGQARTIRLRETPIPGTFSVFQGLTLLGNESYERNGMAITFSGDEERAGLVIRYQTSAYANAGLALRREHYTPRVDEISFERMF